MLSSVWLLLVTAGSLLLGGPTFAAADLFAAADDGPGGGVEASATLTPTSLPSPVPSPSPTDGGDFDITSNVEGAAVAEVVGEFSIVGVSLADAQANEAILQAAVAAEAGVDPSTVVIETVGGVGNTRRRRLASNHVIGVGYRIVCASSQATLIQTQITSVSISQFASTIVTQATRVSVTVFQSVTVQQQVTSTVTTCGSACNTCNSCPIAPGLQCGAFISDDCASEYNNAIVNGNLQSFYDRCKYEGGSSPLRTRCSKCCVVSPPGPITAGMVTTGPTTPGGIGVSNPLPYPQPAVDCTTTVSSDCFSEYQNAERNGNLEPFFNRCVTEGGSQPLRTRCAYCCVPPTGPIQVPTPTIPPVVPQEPNTQQCGTFVSDDCASEYNNAVTNNNLASFYNRCATEGGSQPLRTRCSYCCAQFACCDPCSG